MSNELEQLQHTTYNSHLCDSYQLLLSSGLISYMVVQPRHIHITCTCTHRDTHAYARAHVSSCAQGGCAGSKAFEEQGERISDLQAILQRAAEVSTCVRRRGFVPAV